MRIGRKLVVNYTLLALFTLLITVLVLRTAVAYVYGETLTQQLTSEANTVAVTINDIGKSEFGDDRSKRMIKQLSESLKVRITLIETDGTVVADSDADPATMDNHRGRPEIREALSGKIGESERFSSTLGHSMLYLAVPYKTNGTVAGAIRLAIPLSDMRNALNSISLWMLAVTAAAMFLVVFTSRILSTSFTVPLTRMRAMAERMANDDLEQQLPIDTRDEIAELSQSLNNLAVKLKGRIEELRSEKAKAELILNNMTEGIILLDKDCKVMLANPAAENIFGVRSSDIEGKCIRDAITSYDFSVTLEEALSNGKEVADEIDLLTPFKNARILIIPIVDGPDDERALIVVRDTTREKQIERVRKDFVANVSHELKTPLTGLKLLSETLKRSIIDDPEKTKMFVDKLDQELMRIINLVRELIDLSKLESTKDTVQKSAVSLTVLVPEVAESFAELASNKGLHLLIDIPENRSNIPAILGDKDQLLTLIRNLIDNAIRYTPAGGEINISVKRTDSTVGIAVSDTGIGMAKREIPRIFERFYRVDKARSRETGGTGLGLSIVRHIAENHSATIEVKSDLGIGSTFIVQFPISRQ